MASSRWLRAALLFLCASDLLLLPPLGAYAADTPGQATPPPQKKKKDIRDYNDADMARLLEQWEKDDDIEEGDLPEHKRPSAPVDFSKLDPGKPESILKMTKKGKTLMMFVTVSGSPTEKETEEITSLWQGSLFNANYDVQRYMSGDDCSLMEALLLKGAGVACSGTEASRLLAMLPFIVGSDRAIFMLRDGSYAWEIKDFLVSQDRCADVTLEGQVYPGKGGGSKEKNKTKPEKGKKKKEGDPKPRASKEDNRAGSRREDL